MPHWGKVTGEYEVICGFSNGLLMFGGFLVWVYPGILPAITGPFLLIVGVLLMLDVAYPYGRQPHLMSEGGGMIAAFVAVVASAVVPGSIYWLLAIGICVAAINFGIKLWRKYRRPKPKVFKS